MVAKPLAYDTVWLPFCPRDANWINYPSTVMAFSIIAVGSFAAAAVAAFRYSSVRPDNAVKVLRTASLSSRAWAAYFALVSLRSVLEAVRFGAVSDGSGPIGASHGKGSGIGIAVSVVHGAGLLMLAAAAGHQLRHRSGGAGSSSSSSSSSNGEPPAASGYGTSGSMIDTLSDHGASLLPDGGSVNGRALGGRRWGDVSTTLRFSPLLGLYVLLLVLKAALERDNDAFVYLFLASFFALKLPLVHLASRIVLSETAESGPTHGSKFAFLVASVLNLGTDMPLEVWTQVLPDNCPFRYAGWVDLILAFYSASLGLWLWFARREFGRNRDECVWSLVARMQDRYDVRAF